jgi:hypothetical protein
MNNHLYHTPAIQNGQEIEYIVALEPWVVETLRSILGRSVVIETVRGNLQGVLTDVKPDHVVVRSYDGDTSFYVRLQQIVHVMPT